MQPTVDRIPARRLIGQIWTALVGPALLAAFVSAAIRLALLRHEAFVTEVFDLGYYTQVIWNTAYGRLFAPSLKLPTFLIDHFSPALALLAPLFWVAPDEGTLSVVAVLALASAIVPAYVILRRRHPWLAPLLILAFIFNPLLHALATDEFHEIMLVTPLLGIAMYALFQERYRLLVVSLLVTLLVREDMGIYLASFGLYLILFRRHARAGLALIAAGVVWLPLVSNIIVPILAAGEYRHGNLLAEFIKTDTEGVRNLVRSPLQTIKATLRGKQFHALVQLLRPLVGVPLVALGEQILWLPALLLLPASPDLYISTLNHCMRRPFCRCCGLHRRRFWRAPQRAGQPWA